MSQEEVKLNIEQPGAYIVKFGSLPQDREPKQVIINGTIDAVAAFVGARADEILSKPSYVLASIDKGEIALVVDESSYFRTEVRGKLELHPDYTKWGINTDKEYSSLDLAHFIKMNRFMLPSTTKAMELVSVFQTLKAKVQKEVELSDDKRGNKTNLQSQVVLNMSIPQGFTLEVSLFKGFPKTKIEVEIAINADTLYIQLVSPDANDVINTSKEMIIHDNLNAITGQLSNGQLTNANVPIMFY